MSSSRAALSHNIQEQRSHRSGKPSHSIHVLLFFLAHMYTKLIVGHNIETYRLDIHNQRRDPQNPVYASLCTIEKTMPKICQDTPTNHPIELAMFLTHLPHLIYMKILVNDSFIPSVHCNDIQTNNPQFAPRKLNLDNIAYVEYLKSSVKNDYRNSPKTPNPTPTHVAPHCNRTKLLAHNHTFYQNLHIAFRKPAKAQALTKAMQPYIQTATYQASD
jgi:hypothetical protein